MEQMKRGCRIPYCWYEAKSKGLCASHFVEWKKTGKHQFYRETWDIEQTHNKPLTYSGYKRALDKMTHALPVDRALKHRFHKVMLTKYRKVQPPQTQKYRGSYE